MEVIKGKYCGFCYGVSKALSTTYKKMNDTKLCTYGAIINNKEVTNSLAEKGVRIIENIDEVEDESVIIRSHGVSPHVYESLSQKGISYIDCTCPDVKKIHKIAETAKANGNTVIIIGNENHPEIIGIKGYAGEDSVIICNPNQLEELNLDKNKKYALVVQTTFMQEKFEQILCKIKEMQLDVEIFNTICQAMLNRQKEAFDISKVVDIMIVIGDKNSSNTNKLYEICKKNCEKTFLIETIQDLQLNIFSASVKIGIVAGASTPPEIIKEAFLTMSELDNANKNESFEEMLNESFITLHTGDVVKGTVIRVSNGEVSVNLGYKSDGLIPKNEFSDNPNIDPQTLLKPGDEIEVFVVRVNDGDGNVLLSKKKLDSRKSFEEIEKAFNEKTPVSGKIVDVVKGGAIANIKGVRVFVPSSQVSNRFVEDLNQLKGKEFNFEIIEFEKGKRRIVAGRKALAAKEEKENKEKVFSSVEVGQQIEATVNRIVNFGAFVDLGGVDGLIHISELSWGRVKKVTDVLSEGDKVKVTVLEVDKDKGRISLSLKDIKNDPWSTVAERYEIGQLIKGKVVRMVPFGAFIELEEGIDGLVHISQISSKHVVKPEDELKIGEIIEVKVMEIDKENSRISLSKKAADGVMAEDNSETEAVTETSENTETVTE